MFGKNKEHYVKSGDSHFESGEFIKAVELYSKIINVSVTTSGEDCEIYNKRGRVYSELGG
jgi:hypothetical protein